MQKIIDFSTYSSIRIGGKVLVDVIDEPIELPPNALVVGSASNLLISPNANNIFMLSKEFEYITDLGDLIEVGGATSSGKIYSFFKKHNLGGLEFLRGLPGSLGGLVKMNAGMKQYEMSNILDSVLVDGKWQEPKGFGYRDSGISGVIYGARFKKVFGFREELVAVFESMRQTHPNEPSCGSCFKNPINDFAGRILQECGLKGHRVGDVGFSQKHANFLVNFGGGVFEDAISLIDFAKNRAFECFGVDLECEVVIRF